MLGSSLLMRRYQVWPGNNTFLCRGRVMLGPGPWSCTGTLCLILIPSAIFLADTCPHLLASGVTPLLPAGVIVLLALLLYFLGARARAGRAEVAPQREVRTHALEVGPPTKPLTGKQGTATGGI